MKIQWLMAAAAVGCFAAASAQASTNFALSSEGASFVSGSSIIADGTFGLSISHAQMEANLLTNTPSPAISNGDERYIFGDSDPAGTIVIDLGSERALTSIGAIVDTPAMGDRPISAFSVEISTDGMNFTPWGSEPINGMTTDPLSIAGSGTAQYVLYDFGPTGTPYGLGNGGSGISQLEANGVPEPASWAIMLVGFGAVGATMRSRRRQVAAA